MTSHFHFLERGIDRVFMGRKAPTLPTPNVVKDNTAVNEFAKHNQTTVTDHVTSNLSSLGPRKKGPFLEIIFPVVSGKFCPFFSPYVAVTD